MRYWESPDRHDLVNAPYGMGGSMDPHPQGDYVRYDDYQDLFEAFETLRDALGNIADLAKNKIDEVKK